MKHASLFLIISLISVTFVIDQDSTSTLSSEKKTNQAMEYKHSIGASLLMESNFPEEFAAIEEGAPRYIFEPSLNFVFKF
jgi:hypothetical protein